MNCKDCPSFRIQQEPYRTKNTLWDMGIAICEKYDMIVSFASHRMFDRLRCPEDKKEADE